MKTLVRATTLGLSLALGCAAVTFATEANAATTESTGQYVSSSALTAKVKAALVGTQGIDSNDINVKTVGGVVTLNGAVANSAQVELAGKVAAGVDGVKQVQNNLKSAD